MATPRIGSASFAALEPNLPLTLGRRSRVLDQVANGVSIRMAILYLLLANEEHK